MNRSVCRAITLLLCFACLAMSVGSAAEPTGNSAAAWRFVSIPDFLNSDVAYPEPKWDSALDCVLSAIKAEHPDFVVVPGDLVMGHWSGSRDYLEKQAATYYPAWVKRMQAHGLKFYAAVGDHELGDNPWKGQKRQFVPYYEEAFRRHLRMPQDGPAHMKGLAFSVVHKDLLLIVLDVFEQDENGEVRMDVSGRQLAWVRDVLERGARNRHVVVVGHVPALPEKPGHPGGGLSLEGGAESELWRTLEKYAVDLYLCGHRHTVYIQRKGDVHQILHGSSPNKQSNFNYLLVNVFPDRLELELKRIGTILAGDEGGPYKYANRIVKISEQTKRKGFVSVGKMTIRKDGTAKRFEYESGVFRSRFRDWDAQP